MIKSLRWRLQIWHAFLLFAVLVVFGTFVCVQGKKIRFDGIDAELIAAAKIIEGTLRALPPEWLENGAPDLRERDEEGRRRPPPLLEPREDRRPRPPPHGRLLETLRLPLELVAKYDEEHSPYFFVLAGNGKVLKADPRSINTSEIFALQHSYDAPLMVQQRGMFRDVILKAPHQAKIVVGRDVALEMVFFDSLTVQVILGGICVFAVGLVGGSMLSRRAVAPIDAMSKTAVTITASNLSQRIDASDFDAEFERLASLLNEMFGRLESSFDQQVRFTADASHELRTPLAAVLANAEHALSKERSSDEYRQALEVCQRSAKRMKALVESLLALARLDSGETEWQHQVFDISAAAAECGEIVRPLASERGLRLKIKLESVSVVGDEQRLSQVITNLLTNAVVYNSEQGSIELAVYPEDKQAIVKVTDTGIGIPEEDLSHIFERFYRVDKARSRAVGGCGLGLAICKRIVDAHNGTIRFHSTPGKGTTVEVRLPIRKSLAETSTSRNEAQGDTKDK